jgi:predicted lipid-binding transport protein (Tim44 family)
LFTKRIIALALMMLLLSTVCFAAVSSSGSKSSSSSSQTTSASPSTGSSTYKPSAPASSYSNTAPTKPSAPGSQPQSSNSFWHNVSLFGGGMLAGHLLGNLFGFGHHMGMGSSLLGMIFNLLLIGGMIKFVRYLWNKYQNNNRNMR